jgi:hypothetical protein
VVDEEIKVPGNLRVAKASAPAGSMPNGPWSTTGGAGVFSPAAPIGYTTSSAAANLINATSFFALASTNKVDNPLTGAPPASAPLPVKLVQFAAAYQGSSVRVTWATASEQNSSHFLVQRSGDGISFADVQRVNAQGTTAQHHAYQHLDVAPLPGISYYRLRQVDTDGSASYSPVVSVRAPAERVEAPQLVVYPNPATTAGFEVLARNFAAQGGTIQLFNSVGGLVLTRVATPGVDHVFVEPGKALAPGIYFVTWQTPDGRKLTARVAVN